MIASWKCIIDNASCRVMLADPTVKNNQLLKLVDTSKSPGGDGGS